LTEDPATTLVVKIVTKVTSTITLRLRTGMSLMITHGEVTVENDVFAYRLAKGVHTS
jgi:hypothetical protein